MRLLKNDKKIICAEIKMSDDQLIYHVVSNEFLHWTLKHSEVFKNVPKCLRGYIVKNYMNSYIIVDKSEISDWMLKMIIEGMLNGTKLKGVTIDNKLYDYRIPESEENNTFQLEYKFDMDNEYGESLEESLDLFASQVKKCGHENTLFQKPFILFNMTGINEDKRGRQSLDKDLPFYDELKVGNSLKDLYEGVIHCKSHKFENWYEMFSACLCEEKDDVFELSLYFNHGS